MARALPGADLAAEEVGRGEAPGTGRDGAGLGRQDATAAARALGRLREMLAAHMSGNGVWFDSRAWIVTARRH